MVKKIVVGDDQGLETTLDGPISLGGKWLMYAILKWLNYICFDWLTCHALFHLSRQPWWLSKEEGEEKERDVSPLDIDFMSCVSPQQIYGAKHKVVPRLQANKWANDQGEPAVSYKWTGGVWEPVEVQDCRIITGHFRVIYRI